MKEDITRLFDKITPIRSDDEIIANVIGKAENMEEKNTKRNKGFRKPLIAACAAVTVLAIGTIGVGAANNWDYASLLTNFFSGRAIQNQSSLQNGFDFEKYGMVLDKTIAHEHYTLDIHGIAADTNTAYILLDVIVDDLKGEVDDDFVHLIGFVDMEAMGEPITDCSSYSHLIKRDGNKFTMAVSFSVEKVFPNDIVGFDIHFLTYQLLNGDQIEVDINETIEIDMSSFERSPDIKIVRPNHIYMIDGSEITLTEIRVSPFRISYDLTADLETRKATRLMFIGGNVTITLSDGTEMRHISGRLGGIEKDTGEIVFAYPINTDDVVSVTIAGVTYDFTNE